MVRFSKLLISYCNREISSHISRTKIFGELSKNFWSTSSDSNNTVAACPYPLLPAQCIKTLNKDTWFESKLQDKKVYLSNLFHLSKPRLTSLVTLSSIAGAVIVPGTVDYLSLFGGTIGTFMLSSSANAVNQIIEVPYDSQMSRTQNRMLVTNTLQLIDAIIFSIGTFSIGFFSLYIFTNPLTSLLGLTNFILYTCLYTQLKRLSILNTWVGSIVGAIPPFMGWCSLTNGDLFNPSPWLLSALLYSWQLPHFNSLSWNLRPEYSKAGYMMMSVTHPNLCRKVTLRHSVLVTLFSFIIYFTTSLNNISYLIVTLPINVITNWFAYKFYKNTNAINARKLHHMCLIQLSSILFLLISFNLIKSRENKKSEHNENKE